MIPLGILGNRRGGAAAGAYELISTTTASGGETSITFSSIVSTYKHLQLRMVVRDTNDFAGGTLRNLTVRFNSDSASNYNGHSLIGYEGTSVISESYSSSSSMPIKYGTLDDTAGTGIYATTIFDVLDYASTSKNKTVRYLLGVVGANTRKDVILGSGLWQSTSAISSVTIYPAVGFKAASRFSLYGIRG
jgi:hypothetical protein